MEFDAVNVVQTFDAMPESSHAEKITKLSYARGELDKSSQMVLEMTESIQALLEKFERTKAKQEKKKQKLQEDLQTQMQSVMELTQRNEELLTQQNAFRKDSKRLKKDMNESIKRVMAEMDSKFQLLQQENSRLHQEISKYKGQKSSRSQKMN